MTLPSGENRDTGEDGGDKRPQPTILLFEDDFNQAEPLLDVLQFNGYACALARNEARAREELANPDQRFDVMIADVNLTKSDHIAFIRDTREMPRYSALPVIIATGHDSQDAREQADLLGCAGYLVKPFSTATLLQLIARWIDANPH